jgi:AcrR family transcriptional regulator
MSPIAASKPNRPTQAHRRARTRAALLEAAAQGISRYGYTDLVLERVANQAGYSRGALYHLFANKEELALAVVNWVEETWYEELGYLFADETDPVGALIALARGYAVYCRRDVARVMMTLRTEFEGRDHPVGRAVQEAIGRVIEDSARLIIAGRASGAIPPGPPPETLARAYVGAVEGLVIYLVGQEPFDVQFAQRTALGVLGLAPIPDSPDTA